MAEVRYEKDITALLVVDPYNDFISEGGKNGIASRGCRSERLVPHMLQILNAARQAKVRVFYVPHRRYRPGDFETWKYIAPIQKAAWMRRSFEYGTWGGEFRAEFEPKPGEIVVRALVFQRFRQHRFGFAAQETRHPSAHRHRSHRAYLRRSNGPLCR